MVEVCYERDLNHNYMIVENEQIAGGEYTIRMVEQNDIPELLKFKIRRMNGKTYLCYEITSRQSIAQIFENCCMKRRDMEQLLLGIQNALNRVHQYLLNSEELLLKPEYIYLDVDTRQIQVCYVPYLEALGESGKQSFRELAEFILKRLDHGERRAVDLGYELFELVSRENFSLQESLRLLLREKEEGDGDGYDPGICGGQSEEAYGIEREDLYGGRSKSANGGKNRKKYGGQSKDEYVGQSEEAYGIEREDLYGGRSKNAYDGENEKKYRRMGGEDGGGRNKDRKRDGDQGKKSPKGVENRIFKERKNYGDGGNRKAEGRKGIKILACSGAVLVLAALFLAVVYFGGLDLTQTGGLAFLILAVIWIGYSILAARKQKKKKHWVDEDVEEDDEDAFIEALLSEASEQGQRKFYYGKDAGMEHGGRPGEVYEELSGETRCLTGTARGKQLRLMSQEPEKYQDIQVDQETAVVGKRRDQVDIWIGWEAVSRLHAKLEVKEEGCFVTDLNSMNGTFVNGDRLKPNERRSICHGDRVSFANLHYRIKIRDF